MPDPFEIEPFADQMARVLRLYPPLPAWQERRLLRANERVTWVLGPRWAPWWEPFVTHPALFLVALILGAFCWWVGRQGVDVILGAPVLAVTGVVLVLGSVLVLGIFAGYFTRLVVTNQRIVILQGHEVCRTWRLDALPPSLVRFSKREGQEGASPVVDLDALQTMLGSNDQFADPKTIRKLGKQLDGITAREPRRPGPDQILPGD